MYLDMHIGQLIKEVLDKKKIVYSKVAKDISVSPQAFSAIFGRKSPDLETVIKIGNAIDFDFLEVIRLENSVSSNLNVVNEPEEGYNKMTSITKKIPITVELDGTKATLNYWLNQLKAINSALI